MMEAAPSVLLSVVVPVYNERENLPLLLSEVRQALDPLGEPYEIICIDDGSTDGSLDVLKELGPVHPMLRILVFEKNAGQSAAFAAGFRAARGDRIVTLDADLQNDPADIPRLLSELDRFDAAVGWRVKRADSLLKRISSRVGNGVRNWATREVIADTGCSLKAFRREALAPLKLYRGLHRFLPTLIRMEGFSVTQVRVNHRPRTRGKTKYGVLDRLRATVPDLMAVRWMQSRLIRYSVKEELGPWPS